MLPVSGPIRFACQGCGSCCTGEPGTVYVLPGEVHRIADYLGLGPARLKKEALYPFRGGYSIKENSRGDCLFYHQGCRIYPVRPRQCSCFPFWRKNLRSAYAWKQASKACPGIGSGQVYSRQEILDILEVSPL